MFATLWVHPHIIGSLARCSHSSTSAFKKIAGVGIEHHFFLVMGQVRYLTFPLPQIVK